MTDLQNLKDRFHYYVLSFYGHDGIYDMGATMEQVIEATEKHIKESGIPFAGDSIDREIVGEIMTRDYGLVHPLSKKKLAH
jgi:hypothetical protein